MTSLIRAAAAALMFLALTPAVSHAVAFRAVADVGTTGPTDPVSLLGITVSTGDLVTVEFDLDFTVTPTSESASNVVWDTAEVLRSFIFKANGGTLDVLASVSSPDILVEFSQDGTDTTLRIVVVEGMTSLFNISAIALPGLLASFDDRVLSARTIFANAGRNSQIAALQGASPTDFTGFVGGPGADGSFFEGGLAVPLPAGGFLLLTGLAGLAVMRRRKRTP